MAATNALIQHAGSQAVWKGDYKHRGFSPQTTCVRYYRIKLLHSPALWWGANTPCCPARSRIVRMVISRMSSTYGSDLRTSQNGDLAHHHHDSASLLGLMGAGWKCQLSECSTWEKLQRRWREKEKMNERASEKRSNRVKFFWLRTNFTDNENAFDDLQSVTLTLDVNGGQ